MSTIPSEVAAGNINRFAYELYDLTEDTIRIVEEAAT